MPVFHKVGPWQMSEDFLVTITQKVEKNSKRWKKRMKNKVSVMVTAYKINIKSAVGLLSIVIFFTAADHVLLFQTLVELFSIRI